MSFSFRTGVQIALLRLFGGDRVTPVPDWNARPYRVLFIRDDGIGDLIVSMKVLEAIAATPNITLDLLCSPQNAALARTLPYISDVIVHRRRSLYEARPTWRELRKRGYDVVIDGRIAVGNVNTHTSALILSTQARWRIGMGGRRNDRVYTIAVRPDVTEHWVDRLASLAKPFGVSASSRDWRPHLQVSDDDLARAEETWMKIGAGRPRVFVNISVGNSERFWRHDRYAPVLARLRQRLPDATILLSSMPNEQAAADALAQPVGASALPLTFVDAVAAVATSDFVISPDTAMTHVASAFEKPTLAMMRRDTADWGPYRTPGRMVFGDIKRRLEPGLPEERVVEALDAMISELGPEYGWT